MEQYVMSPTWKAPPRDVKCVRKVIYHNSSKKKGSWLSKYMADTENTKTIMETYFRLRHLAFTSRGVSGSETMLLAELDAPASVSHSGVPSDGSSTWHIEYRRIYEKNDPESTNKSWRYTKGESQQTLSLSTLCSSMILKGKQTPFLRLS